MGTLLHFLSILGLQCTLPILFLAVQQVSSLQRTGNNIILLAGIRGDPPMYYDHEDPKPGILVEMVEFLQSMAAEDGYNLTIIYERVPPCEQKVDSRPSISPACRHIDMLINSVTPSPARLSQMDFTPPLMEASISASRYVGEDVVDQSGRIISSFAEANRFGASICVSARRPYVPTVMGLYPNAKYVMCNGFLKCKEELKAGNCSLFAHRNYNLDYQSILDPTLVRTREAVGRNFIVWPINYNVDAEVRSLIKRWTYMMTIQDNIIDDILKKYLDPYRCPLGFAGDTCEDPCDPDHGISDSHGKCICDSNKWIGDDCSVEDLEDKGLIRTWQRRLAYAMFGFNVLLVVFCGVWLVVNRNRADVIVAQPLFLGLVLVGCLISSSTILALMQESEDDNSSAVHCMLIPWLYSIGFSITFGTLFTKMVRVHMLVRAASRMRRIHITWKAALRWICFVLFLDVMYLVLWQTIDPLKWKRSVITEDKFGNVLSSSGTCTSEHLASFGSILLSFHFLLMGWGSYICYATRMVPEELSGARSTSIAMVSNFQIVLVGLPMILLVGSDPDTSFILRSTLLWMNDLLVVFVIFGNLMIFRKKPSDDTTADDIVHTSITTYMSTSKTRLSHADSGTDLAANNPDSS